MAFPSQTWGFSSDFIPLPEVSLSPVFQPVQQCINCSPQSGLVCRLAESVKEGMPEFIGIGNLFSLKSLQVLWAGWGVASTNSFMLWVYKHLANITSRSLQVVLSWRVKSVLLYHESITGWSIGGQNFQKFCTLNCVPGWITLKCMDWVGGNSE